MRRSSLEGDTLGTTRGIVGGPHCIPAGSPAISDRQKKAILLQSAEEIRKVFLRAEADKVAHTKIRVEDWVRDSPRHFAACRNDGSLIVLASDLALLPAKTFAAIIAHEFGHATDFSYPGSFLLSNKGELVVRPQGRRSNQSVSRDVLERWESRSSDEVETTADRIAERIMGIHIGYCGPCNLQTMLTGSPDEASCHTSRPRGLRLDIMSYETKPSYTVSNQAELSQLVPDSDEGSTAYCVLEKTYWQLSLTSVQTLSPSCLATKSGTGRWVLAGPIAPASLPAPRVRLLLGSVHNGLTRTGNNIVCDGVIKLGTDGLREDLLSNLSYKTQIELLRYVPNRSKRVQQPSPSYAKMYGGFYHPSMPGSGSGGTRGGSINGVSVSRPTEWAVAGFSTGQGIDLNVGDVLAPYFEIVKYRDSSGSSLLLAVYWIGRKRLSPSGVHSYAPNPPRGIFAFRYACWDSVSQKWVSGPMSPIITVRPSRWPAAPTYSYPDADVLSSESANSLVLTSSIGGYVTRKTL